MSPDLPRILLASSSIYRQQLLGKLGLPFHCQSPKVDESKQPQETIEQMVARLSLNKAQAVASAHPDAIVIASDQTACTKNQALGKAGNYQTAFEQLKAQSGQCIDFYTGLVVYNPSTQNYLRAMDHTQVYFRSLSDTQIHNYLMAEKPYDCAGSFKSEGLGICLFDRIATQDPNALIGLPLIQLVNLFKQMGISLPITRPAAR
ncbi:Maf family protein [Thiomicrospira microaerophila]|uniref:Maf family protein n=1 Tax=Thiomicrospira microaerophila TaxID=406020 RepID=UPI0005C8D537|nr:nucleoside triphosphate pyrophosphatase [Thiomicrospira microaerophila]